MSASETPIPDTTPVLLFVCGDDVSKGFAMPHLIDTTALFTAESASEALHLFHEKHPRIVVISTELADMSGFELCAQLHALSPESFLILIGKKNSAQVYQRSMEAGADRYISIDACHGDLFQKIISGKLALFQARGRQHKEVAALRAEMGTLEAARKEIIRTQERVADLIVQRDALFDLVSRFDTIPAVIHELKDLAGLMASDGGPAAEPFYLRPLLSSLQSSFSQGGLGTEVSFNCTIPDYVPNCFQSHPAAVARALACLLENALVNSSDKSLTLKVDLKEKNLSETRIQFVVGFANSEITMNNVEPMHVYLAGLNRSKAAPPLRSGLSLAAKLVELLGGTVWVKSIMGRGCTYYISLPMHECSTDEIVFHNTSSAEISIAPVPLLEKSAITLPVKRRVLLADDNDVDRLTISRLLEGMGIEVVQVTNGREAIDEFADGSFDVVLMDILMPELDGFEATRLIREHEKMAGMHTPVFALTSYSLKAIHEKCVSVGMEGHLQKPVSLQELTKLFSTGLQKTAAGGEIPQSLEDEDLPVIDFERAMISLDNNKKLYQEIVTLFHATAPQVISQLTGAITSGSSEDVTQWAHKIKGMVSNISAARFVKLTQQIENLAQQDDRQGLLQLTGKLSAEFQVLQDALLSINWDMV